MFSIWVYAWLLISAQPLITQCHNSRATQSVAVSEQNVYGHAQEEPSVNGRTYTKFKEIQATGRLEHGM